MVFAVDMSAAARRHLRAADYLSTTDRRDVAGYLYGIAAECAVKSLMWEAGLRPCGAVRTLGDPFFLHFPDLRSALRNLLSGRRPTHLIQLIQDDRFFSNWAIGMRYSHGKDISEAWIVAWAMQAKRAVDLIGT